MVGLVLTFAAANVAVGAVLVLGIRGALAQGGPPSTSPPSELLLVSSPLVQALVLPTGPGGTAEGSAGQRILERGEAPAL